jgi:ferrous iron transport protein B
VIEARFRWLDREVAPLARRPIDRSRTQRVDRVLLNRVGGFVIFLAIMFVVFQSLFAWSEPAIALVESVFGALGGVVLDLLGPGLLADFIVNALIKGVGSVMVFLPQILLLFFFIGLMEDCGYMARVAYLMDRIMRTMGLHGRAFVPMMSGFACAVPAILSTRTMERKRDRLLTMMVVPLMTCSARLPVYTLVIAALYPDVDVWGFVPVGGLLMVGMYLFSTVTALTAAWVLSKTVKPLRAKRLPFVIELPPYRLPRLRDVVRMMWERSASFLKEAGTVILGCTVVLWALLSFPRDLPEGSPDYGAMIAQATDDEARTALENEQAGERLRNSYAGRLGHAIEPAIEPLGFDWKIGVGLIGAFAAREVFVSTMGVVYSVGEEVNEEDPTLRAKLRSEQHADGSPVYTPLVGLSLMIFFALACQCMSTLAVTRRETRSWRWPVFMFVYMTALAWVASFVVYQGGRLLGF